MRNLQNDIDERYADNLEVANAGETLVLLEMLTELRTEFKAACDCANELQLFVEDLQSKFNAVAAERDAFQAWKEAVPLLEIDIVCTDQLVKNEWEGRCAIIEEWLDVVRTRFEYLSDADRRKVLATLDGAA